jgi:hypothetical protein
MREITLLIAEVMMAAQAGIMRHTENLKTGKYLNTHKYWHTCPWQHHIEGCCGELAVAKKLGLFWHGKGKWEQRDVGRDDVRTRPNHGARMILHPEDHDDVIYWFLTGENGYYRFQGWIYGRDGKNKEKYWGDETGKGRFAFFIDQKFLNPPETHPLWPKT